MCISTVEVVFFMFAILDVLVTVYYSVKFWNFDLLAALRAKCAFLNLVVLSES